MRNHVKFGGDRAWRARQARARVSAEKAVVRQGLEETLARRARVSKSEKKTLRSQSESNT